VTAKRYTILIAFTAVALLVTATLSSAQSPNGGRVWRIGWLSPPSASTGASELEALREGLRALNYVASVSC
jgi:hypothetical protein